MTPVGSLGAILLAGGRATRVGGAAKPLFDVAGRTLLQRGVDAAAAAGAHPLTIVAEPVAVDEPPAGVTWAREDPPFAGPAAAAVAALASWQVQPDWTLVLACDLARPDRAVARLVADAALLGPDVDGLCLADPSGRPQWLTGLYHTAALRSGAEAAPNGGRDLPVRALLDDLAIAVVAVDDAIVEDIDTWDDLARVRAREESMEES